MKIGFFDTGLGGTTIFKKAIEEINAEFIYLADNLCAPYGTKELDAVRNLTENNMKKLLELGCEIIVIACNTATSAAISYLREKYPNIIFIGTEPAIKPAVENINNQKIILTATTLTLKGSKLENLLNNLNIKEKVTFLPLDKLVEYSDFYEKIEYNLAREYLENEFSKLALDEYSGIVLGCTHFPIFKNEIRKILPNTIEIYDSSEGVVKNLKTKIAGIEFPEKSVELVLTKEDSNFRKKFFDMIEI